MRVLYSFPLQLGASQICYTAWQQVNGLAAAGADLLVFPSALYKPVAPGVRVQPTLARGRFRIPYKLVGTLRAVAIHDHIVARRLEKLSGQIDIAHVWPLGALQTLKTAARIGIPTVLERPNAHTRYAMEVVRHECERLGVALPSRHEHAYNEAKIRKEEQEYELATRLVCPSEFVIKTFLDQGFAREKLIRHLYGFDPKTCYPSSQTTHDVTRPLTVLFAGACSVRKGLHFALEAWVQSAASQQGTFLIAGEFLPAYAEKFASYLSHRSVQVLGHRHDLPELMRRSDLLVLPSLEEGSALVTAEARGCGCIVLVSDSAGANCVHMETGLVHRTGDVATLTAQITMLHRDRDLLKKLRENSLSTAHEITWTAAGVKLLEAYKQTVEACRHNSDTADFNPNLFIDREEAASVTVEQ